MKKTSHINGYILCGGKSSRMGTEKGLVRFQNKAFIRWGLEAIQPLTHTIHLVTQNNKYKKFGYPLLKDLVQDKGPVGGIFTALKNSTTDWNLIISCDMPGISTPVLRNLLANREQQASVSFLNDGEKDYPLLGIYHRSILPSFSEALENKDLRLMNLIRKLKFQRLKIPAEQKKFVHNINTKEELNLLTEKS